MWWKWLFRLVLTSQSEWMWLKHEYTNFGLYLLYVQIHMIVLREEKKLEEIEVELQQKPGRGIGLCIIGFSSGKGAYVSELVIHWKNVRHSWTEKNRHFTNSSRISVLVCHYHYYIPQTSFKPELVFLYDPHTTFIWRLIVSGIRL